MKATRHEFPNPVLALGRDDYIDDCRFATYFDPDEVCVTSENIEFPIKYILKCRGLETLIKNNFASVVVNVRSSAASYSRIYRFDSNSNEMIIKIPKFNVVKRIEVKGSIVAKDNIPRFSCPGEFNELYFAKQTFDIRKGDTLATEDPRVIYIDDSELEKPIASIFNIARRDNPNDEVELDYNDDKITIFLSSNLDRLYREFVEFNNGSLRRYATSVIVYPALVEIISLIRACETSEDAEYDVYKERRWYRAIEKKATALNFDFKNPSMNDVSLANKILGEISSDAMRSFKDTLESEANSGETEYIGGID